MASECLKACCFKTARRCTASFNIATSENCSFNDSKIGSGYTLRVVGKQAMCVFVCVRECALEQKNPSIVAGHCGHRKLMLLWTCPIV